MRPHQGVSSSGSAHHTIDPFLDAVRTVQNKTARIYMPLKKHVHNHAMDKSTGKQWVIDFETNSTYKTPLMSWSSGSTDSFYSKGDNM